MIEREPADRAEVQPSPPAPPARSLTTAADARVSIEIARQRALDIDGALAELRASLRSASPPSASDRVNRHGSGVAEMEPAAAFRWLLLDGHEAFCRGRFGDALALFEEAARDAPRRVEGHLNAGRTLIRMRRYAEARGAFGRAIVLEPDSAAARAGMADCDWRLQLPDIEPAPVARPKARFRLSVLRTGRRAN